MPNDLKRAYDTLAEDYKDFAHRVSHDLSAPVRAMVEFSKLLGASQAVAFSEEENEYLSIIIQSGQKMQAMMDGLLEYSRLSSMSFNPEKIDSIAVMENCQNALSDRIRETNAVLSIGILPTIYTDGAGLKKIFLTLLDNALKFHAKNCAPQISISAQATADTIAFAIKDNGIGIDPCYQERIFKIFQKLHRDEDYQGVGIGLTLAGKIAERLKGRLWIESELGHGSTFFLSLPNGDVQS